MNRYKISQKARDFIRNNYEDMTDRELAKSLGVCSATISDCRKEMGLVRNIAQIKAFIEANYLTMNNKQLSEALYQQFGISAKKSRVANRLYEYGLKRPPKLCPKSQDFVLAHYQEHGNIALSEQLARMGHTVKPSQIGLFLKKNSLERTADLRYRPCPTEIRKKIGNSIRRTWQREKFVMQNGLTPRSGYHYSRKKSGHSCRKFTPDQVRQIRKMTKEELKLFAKEHGVCRATLRQIHRRKTYVDVRD